MPIDTANKRFSMLALAGDDALLPTPDNSLDSVGDRAQLLGLYAGLTGAPPVTSPVDVNHRPRRRGRRLARYRQPLP